MAARLNRLHPFIYRSSELMSKQIDPYETKTIAEVLEEFKVKTEDGLSDLEVSERQNTYGLNEVPEEKQSIVLLFLMHFWGLTAFMLEFTIVVSFLLRKYVDVYLIGGLIYAIIADRLFIIGILMVHVPGFTMLSIAVTGSSLLYFSICSLLVNDWIKVKISVIKFNVT